MARGFRAAILSLPVLLVLPSCGGIEDRAPPDVLLVTTDTTRADELAIYGGAASTPNIDRLAAQGVVYLDAATPMPTTRPAHASLFTGVPPRIHGVGDNATALAPELPTLAARLRDGGWRTGAFTAASILDRDSGLLAGFSVHRGSPDRPQRPGDEVADEAVRWIEAAKKENPLFVWVHFFDPHMPYGPEEGPRFDRPSLQEWTVDGDIPTAGLEEVLRLYRTDIEGMDRALGRVLDAFETRRSSRPLVGALVADHGECFEEGYYFEHGHCLYEGSLRVPMVVFASDERLGRRIDARPTSLIDVGSTLLALAGRPEVLGEGVSLLESAEGREIRYAEHWGASKEVVHRRSKRRRGLVSVAGDRLREEDGAPARAVVTPDWILVETNGESRLVPRNPRSRATSSTERSRVRLSLVRELKAFPPWKGPRFDPAAPEPRQTDLEALGYL